MEPADTQDWIAQACDFVRREQRAIELIASQLSQTHRGLSGDECVILINVADGTATLDDLAQYRAKFPGHVGYEPRPHVKVDD